MPDPTPLLPFLLLAVFAGGAPRAPHEFSPPRRTPLQDRKIRKVDPRKERSVKFPAGEEHKIKAVAVVGGCLQCSICKRILRSHLAFRNHVKIFHIKGRYECSYCGNRTFVRKCNLLNHQRLHEGDRPFACRFCNRTFAHKQTQENHERIHTGARPFNCSLCGHSFRQKGSLLAHFRMHTKEKPFICGHCGKAFSEQSNLRLHQYMHLGIMPFQCTKCNQSFNRPHNLQRHARGHDRYHFKCNFCQIRFAKSAHLKEHQPSCPAIKH